MSVFYILGHISSMLITCFILYDFYTIFGKKMLIRPYIYIILMLVFITAGSCINLFLTIKPLAICLLFLIHAGITFAFDMPLGKKVLSSILIYILISVMEILTTLVLSLIIGKSPEEALASGAVFFIAAVLSKVITLTLVKMLHVKMKSTNNTDISTIVACIVLSIITFAIMAFVSYQLEKSNDVHVIVFGVVVVVLLVVSDLLILYLFTRMARMKEQENISLMERVELENEREYYAGLYAQQSQSDKTMHDLKHQVFALEEMLDKNSIEARKLIKSITDTIKTNHITAYTGNISIDALLNKKIEESETRSIDINISSYISDFYGYDVVDICIILGNLIDNAIESCIKLKENKAIDVILKQDESGILIKISNNCDLDTKVTEHTTKVDKVHHGYGISNVKSVVSKYNGYYDVSVKNGKYVVTIFFDNSEC